MKLRTWLLILVAVVVGLGCGRGNFSERSASTSSEKVFRYPIVTNPTTLDPHRVEDGDTIDLLQQVYEGLVQWDENNKVVPALAESWTVSDDGTLYTFKLKTGVKFHNGDPVTAEDVKWSIERACDPALKSATVSSYLNDIVGAADMYNGKSKEISGIKVVDPATITIQIDAPRPYFLGKLTFQTSAVVSKRAAKMGKEISSVEEAVGTGPFKFSEFKPEQSVRLVANKEYHGGAPKLDAIERPIIKDATTRLNKYKNGELDLVMLERGDVAGLQADDKFKSHLQFFPRPALWYVGLNVKEYKPFADRRVRQAFAMAIDKDRIVNELLGGINQVANSIVPPGVLGYRENAQAIDYNVEQGKKLLAEAGYADGKGLPELVMTFREQRPDIRLVAEAVASDLKKNLGVNVTLRTMEWRAYLEAHNRKEHKFFHMRWAADYLDPENFLSLLLAGYGAQNKVNYENPAYDALTKQADSLMDEAKRLELYAKAEDMVLQDAPFIPIYFQKDAELISPRVSGMRGSLFGHLPHTTVDLK